MAKQAVAVLEPVSNDAAESISFEEPYTVEITVEGTTSILFHRWSCESVEQKAKAGKNSKAKKTDDVESYVARNDAGELCIPGEYFRMSIINAAKFRQDPRSPRKSAMDLFRAGIVVDSELCSLGKKNWDKIDQRRVQVQRAGITRHRPAMFPGWRTSVRLFVMLPEYISPAMLNEIVQSAGRLVGVGDHRPSYGRFAVTKFEVLR